MEGAPSTVVPSERLQLVEPQERTSRFLGLTISSEAQTNIRRLPKTIGLVAVWINMGLVMSAQAVTLVDMLPRIGADYESIAFAIAIGSLTCVVLIPFGVFCDRYYKSVNLVMSVSLVWVAINCVAIPWTRSLGAFGVVNTMMVFGHTLQNPVGNFMMATLWKEQASCPLHVMHLGWGVGAFLSPVLFRPFLSPDTNNSSMSGMAKDEEYPSTIAPASSEIDSTIEIPYGILGGSNFLCALVFLCFHFCGEPMQLNYEHTSRSIKEIFKDYCHPGNWAKGDVVYGTVILIGVIGFYVGLESMGTPFHLFLFSFAVESKFKFPKKEAALLDAAFNLTYSIGRVTFGIMSVFIPLQNLLFVELSAVLVAMTCMTFFLNSKLHLWIYVCFYAFMCGPIWPGGLSWSNKYILFTATFSTWVHIAPQIIGIGSKWLVGHLFQEAGPMYAIYFGFGSCVFLLMVMTSLQTFVLCKGNSKRE